MPPILISVLLIAALLIWYDHNARLGEPTVRHCPHCGDLVEVIPGLLMRCPTCSRLVFVA